MTSPVVIPAGHKLLAADFDAYENLTAAWTDYSGTFAWTATTNPVIGNGSIIADFIQAGKFVAVRIQIIMGSTTTFGTGLWVLSLPVSASASAFTFAALANDSSASLRYNGTTWVGADAANTMRVIFGQGVSGASATSPFTWATGDRLIVAGCYRAS